MKHSSWRKIFLLGCSGLLTAGCAIAIALIFFTANEARIKHSNAQKAQTVTRGCPGCDFASRNFQGKDMRAMQLQNADFRRANLQGTLLRESNLTDADLREANLRGADLSGEATRLENADLSGADLSYARMYGSNFKGANLQGANLRGVEWEATDLEGVNLKDAELSGVSFDKVRLCNTTLPDGRVVNRHCLSSSANWNPWFTAKTWEIAESKTSEMFLRTFNRQGEGWLLPEQIEQVSCSNLASLDRLWTSRSAGHFGFSVQRRIWESPEVNRDYGRFADRVGWRRDNVWLKRDRLDFRGKAPSGHLPWHSWQVQQPTAEEPTRFRRVGFGVLMSKLAECGI